MGGESSKYNKVGGIVIQLEILSCYAGETVNGIIHISVKAEIQASSSVHV